MSLKRSRQWVFDSSDESLRELAAELEEAASDASDAENTPMEADGGANLKRCRPLSLTGPAAAHSNPFVMHPEPVRTFAPPPPQWGGASAFGAPLAPSAVPAEAPSATVSHPSISNSNSSTDHDRSEALIAENTFLRRAVQILMSKKRRADQTMQARADCRLILLLFQRLLWAFRALQAQAADIDALRTEASSLHRANYELRLHLAHAAGFSKDY